MSQLKKQLLDGHCLCSWFVCNVFPDQTKPAGGRGDTPGTSRHQIISGSRVYPGNIGRIHTGLDTDTSIHPTHTPSRNLVKPIHLPDCFGTVEETREPGGTPHRHREKEYRNINNHKKGKVDEYAEAVLQH